MAFIKNKEDFVCENCGAEVKGTGYTNHCPKCLYSKHVDIDPGDRNADCGGLMEPVGSEFEKGEYHVILKCIKCGAIKRNRISEDDNMDALINIVKNKNEEN